MLARVGELLTTRPAVWLAGFTVGVIVLVMTSLLGATTSVPVAAVLVLLAAAGLVFKDRVLILRRRILLTRQRTSRRQFLATTLSVAITASLTVALGWLLGEFIRNSYEEQLRRHLRPRRPSK